MALSVVEAEILAPDARRFLYSWCARQSLNEEVNSKTDAARPLTSASRERAGTGCVCRIKHFYPAVKAKRTEDILLEALEEHLGIERVIADLLVTDSTNETFDAKMKVLKEQVEHHVKEGRASYFRRSRSFSTSPSSPPSPRKCRA